jgi:hypothetical protein
MTIYRIDNISSHSDFSAYAETKKPEPAAESTDKKEGKGVSFGDILDIVNPLQHVPVVSSVYRSATGDEIAPVARLIGGAIFGQLFGFIAAAVNVVVEAVTGKDIGDHVMTALKGAEDKTEAVAFKQPDTAQLLAMSEDKTEYSDILDALNQAAYSEGIKKYAETKEILESRNYQTDNSASIMA